MKKSILIVDDDPDLREMIADSLSNIECHIELAANGKEGLERFQENPANLVITDLRMPVMGGLELIRALRATDAPTIIAISGVDKQALNGAIDEGASHILEKPISRSTIEDLAKKVLKVG